MPCLDLPLSALHAYPGRNPRPADFDPFWDASIQAMQALDSRLELVPAPFTAAHAECFDLFFTGMGGARIHAKYLRPKGVRPGARRPAVCLYHGYTGASGDWSDKLGWVGQGFAVAALDCRGQGGRSQDLGQVDGTTHHGHIIRGLAERSPAKLLYRDIFLDAAQLARLVMALPEVDPDKVGVTGASQGGALSLAAAALEPRIARCAPIYPFLCDYQRVWEMDLAKEAYAELRTFFRHFDPTHAREEEIFTRLGYIDVQHLAGRIRAPVLMAVGLMDAVCPPSSQFACYNKIRAPKELALYPDFAHEPLPGMADRITAFMAAMAAAPG
jgi:cephalosporin-C deacetylase